MNRHLEKAKKLLPEGVDGVLVTNNQNQLWLTGFLFHDGYVLLTRNECYLLTDSRYIEAAQKGAKDVTVMQMSGPRKQMFLDLCEKNGVKTLAFEDNWTTVSAYENLKKTFEGIELVPAGKLLEELREYKDEEELTTSLRHSALQSRRLSRFWASSPPIRPRLRSRWSLSSSCVQRVRRA
ncbi:MAG: aminopeptidase P family N-terminal domain-containing protein [Clostridia bacterium]|nr:aminopeptidase P family N-terminal domain-containing protein [Clostridia bacterium]